MHKHHSLTDYLKESQCFNKRLAIISIGIAILTLILFSRLIYLQLFQHQRYITLSNLNQLNVVPIPPNRGLIYDRNGVLIADNIPVYSLEITPDRVSNLAQTLKQLTELLNISHEEIETFNRQLEQHRRFESVPLRLKLNEKEIALFSENQYRFPGVEINAGLIRHYPFGNTMAHVLGYVGRINQQELEQVDQTNYHATNFIGKIGIEKFYEGILHGTVGYQQIETDASGRTVRVMHRTPPTPGNNLYLTIDSHLQQVAEKALENQRAAFVAIDPNNGEILALVSNPSFDPNLFVKGINKQEFQELEKSEQQPLYNRAIRGQYPLGSTIKPFISLEALDKEIVTPDYKVWDPGWMQLPNSSHQYRDWNHKNGGHGWVSLKRAIIISCDTYFYHLALLLGISRIDSVLTEFGFGMPTGLDVGEELSGLVASPAWKRKNKGVAWYPGDTLISSIGQGFMLTTPIQLASAIATLSVHGQRYRPHFLLTQEFPNHNKIQKKLEQPQPVNMNHPESWDFITDAMQQVITSNEGTAATRFGKASYTVAAKTGTSQVFSIKQHTTVLTKNLPQKLRDHSLFIAFAPTDHPQIAIAAIVENSTLAPSITRQILDYYFLRNKNGPSQPVS